VLGQYLQQVQPFGWRATGHLHPDRIERTRLNRADPLARGSSGEAGGIGKL
jgi:hypothetical protein